MFDAKRYIPILAVLFSLLGIKHIYADSCMPGNILYNKTPFTTNQSQLKSIGVQRSSRMTDGRKVSEGSFWSVEQAGILSKNGKITFDLDKATSLKAFIIQADNNDKYEFLGSKDGKNFDLLWTAPAHSKPGLRTRSVKLKTATPPVRYLQIRPKEGDSSYSISELQAFCDVPKKFPPKLSITRATRKNTKDGRKHFIGKAKLGLAVFGLLIFFVPRMLVRTREEDEDDDEDDDSNLDQGNDEQNEVTKDSSTDQKANSSLLYKIMRGFSKNETAIQEILVYTLPLISALSTLWIAFGQMNRAIDKWSDNGFLAKGLGHALSLSPSYTHWVFYNGVALAIIGIIVLIYAVFNINKNRPLSQCIPEIQTIGFIGFIWVFATQCNEVMGKTSWPPEGWEGLVIAPILTVIFVYLYKQKYQQVDVDSEDTKESQATATALLQSTQKLGWTTVAVLSIASFVSLGTFHGNRITHFWDSLHYYIGSKYFAETRYHLLYHCITLAEFDDGRHERIKDRPLRSLVDNQVGKSKDLLNPNNKQATDLVNECRAHFSPLRWEAFKQDLRLFRSFMGEAWWKKMFKDHGYNATPVWNMFGHTLTNWNWKDKIPEAGLAYTPGDQSAQSLKAKQESKKIFFNQARPRFEQEIVALNFIDLSLYLILFALFAWAFGLEVAAFMLIFFGTGYPWSYDWTGGSIGRIPWLFTLGAGLCLLKKNYPLMAGFSIGWSLLLRIFPGSVLGGVAVHVGLMIFKKIPWTTAHKRFIMGGLLSFAVLVPLSIPIGQGSHENYQGVTTVYKEFLKNSMKHTGTPMTNNMGFPTLLSYHPGYTVRYASRKQNKMKEKKPAFYLWKTKHNEFKSKRRWLLVLCLLATFYFFYRVRERWELWEVISAGSIFAFFIFELTCYYYCFMIILTPLAFQRSRELLMMLLMVIATQIIQIYVGASDEEYLLESLAVAIPFFVFLIGRYLETLRGGSVKKKVLTSEVN